MCRLLKEPMATDPVQQIFARFEKNLQRTTGLVNSFYPVPGKTGRPATHRSDLLRAAVVLLHSSLEDLLRSLEVELISRYVHSGMSLSGVKFTLPGDKRIDSISLSLLVSTYPKANVADILADAVATHKTLRLKSLERRTYNNVEEVKAALDRVQVPRGTNPLEPYGLTKPDWSLIEAMMKRRHLIAHRADRNDESGKGHHLNKPIGLGELQKWVDKIRALGNSVQQQL